MAKEKYYFKIYLPEYNILKEPGSPSRGSGWKHSEAVIENIRKAAIERSKSTNLLAKLSSSNPSSLRVQVINLETNTVKDYNAIRAAARARTHTS